LPRHFRPPFPRMPALQATRSAQFNLFFLFPAFTGVTAPSRARCHHRSPIWHAPCWATLSKIPASRGLKSRPGELPSSSTTIDFRVSRPPSSVAARDATPCRSTQSIHFLNFLRFFSRGIIWTARACAGAGLRRVCAGIPPFRRVAGDWRGSPGVSAGYSSSCSGSPRRRSGRSDPR